MEAPTRTYQAVVHHEDGSYWAEVPELPGCFAAGDTLDELKESLIEAIVLYLGGEPPERPEGEVEELTVATSAIPQPA